MALLGKLLKGRTTRANANARRNLKVRHINKTQTEYDNDKKLHKMRRDALKSAIAEETKIVSYNKKKLLTNWRNIMRVVKTEQLKNEIEIYSQNNQRELDSKEAFLQMLDKSLDEADEQYQMALRNHLLHLQQLIALQDNRLFVLHNEFDRDVKILQDEFDYEKEQVVKIHADQVRELQDMIDVVREDDKMRSDIAKNEFQSFREEVKNRNMEELDSIRVILEAKQRRLNTDLEALHQKYTNDTQTKNMDHALLFSKNKDNTKEIDGLVKEIDRVKLKIEHMKLKIHQHTKESKKRNDALRREKENMYRNYSELKVKMLKFRDDESKRLGELATNSKNSVSNLNNQLEIGERILKTAELCRRLETEREKVIPFYESTVVDEDVPLPDRLDFSEISQEKYAEYSYLDNFYKRYNKVQLDKIAIEKQKEQLEKENQILKTMLKQYLDGISLNDEVLKTPNPLLVVNDRIQVNKLPIERSMAATTLVDGAKVYVNYQKQLHN